MNVLRENIDLSRYVGQWVVICDNKLVAHNENLNNIQKEVKECKNIPTIVKIPKNDTLIF